MDDDHEIPISDFGLDTPIRLQSQFDTLFAEFSRSRPRVSPPRSPSVLQLHLDPPKDRDERHLDLRSLEYAEDYDSHLMCPICHVPFVEPVVLECDHTFCESCLKEYRDGGPTGHRNQCPTCRAFVLSSARKASRLIVNMCNEIKVKCPNEDCDDTIPRGYIDRHATKECPHERLQCPDSECGKMVKRRNYVPEQCIHSSHIECDCGAVIELGKGEWLRHKDEDCPKTGVKCKLCSQRISARDYLNGVTGHTCNEDHLCPGREYGCADDFNPEDLEHHVKSCPLARMAPHMKKQSQLLQSLQEQLAMVKVRNDVLETGFEKINDIVNDRVLPLIDHATESDIEEIERDHIPSATSHRDLLMPAHLRALTPSPDPEANSLSQTQQHLLAMHESLRTTVGNLENDLTVMANNIADLDARTSMQLMNETLRLKEELAHTNAGLFSTRSQVQWLLNRERIGQQQQAMGMGMRGRTPSTQPQPPPANGGASTRSSVSEGTDMSGVQGSSSERQPSPGFVASSPNFRPQMRRLSGSQERVKL